MVSDGTGTMSSKSLTIRVDDKLHADLTVALIRRRAGTIKDLFYGLVKAWLKNPDILTDSGPAPSLPETVRTYFLKWVTNPYSIPREWGLRFETIASQKITPEEFAARLMEIKRFFDETALTSARMQDLTVPERSLAAKSDSVIGSESKPEFRGTTFGDETAASFHELLDRILASGHTRVINALAHNMDVFAELAVQARGHRNDEGSEIVTPPAAEHGGEPEPASRTAGRKRKTA